MTKPTSAPTKLCPMCEEVTPHEFGMISTNGNLQSHSVCQVCGLEKIGGKVVGANAPTVDMRGSLNG